jgi:hypothetical protein
VFEEFAEHELVNDFLVPRDIEKTGESATLRRSMVAGACLPHQQRSGGSQGSEPSHMPVFLTVRPSASSTSHQRATRSASATPEWIYKSTFSGSRKFDWW